MTVTMQIAYSADEPRLKFVRATPGTIWVPTAAGVHHLGYWSDDVDADAEQLHARGFTLEAKAASPDRSPMWAYCYAPGEGALRTALVSRTLQPVMEQLFVPVGG